MARLDIYPITVIQDRYGGTYSEALWTAFNSEPQNVPTGPFQDDVTCMNFWEDYDEGKLNIIIGKGRTADQAAKDLEEKVLIAKDKDEAESQGDCQHTNITIVHQEPSPFSEREQTPEKRFFECADCGKPLNIHSITQEKRTNL
jgi:hypothetical protein